MKECDVCNKLDKLHFRVKSINVEDFRSVTQYTILLEITETRFTKDIPLEENKKIVELIIVKNKLN